MSLSKRLSLPHLADLCRDLRHYLGAGLTVADAFRRQAKKGPGPVRAVAERVSAELKRGHSLASALRREADVFPPLLLALVDVGESTGMLAEVFAELEKYYARQLQLRRQFLAQITWPVVQFLAAVFILAGLIFFLGIVKDRQGPNDPPYDPLGFGLSGAAGATTFLGIVFGTLAGLFGLYLLVKRVLKRGPTLDAALLRIPAIGPCLRSHALARFCLALRLTFETSMSVGEALRLALRATGNEAFAAEAGSVESAVETGRDLTSILGGTHLFPEEFIHVLAVGEESGRLTEVLKQQGEHYHDESGRRLTALTRTAGYGVWIFVAVLITWAIFRLYSSYLGALGGV
jgi:type IV pilus assembly protein PilC